MDTAPGFPPPTPATAYCPRHRALQQIFVVEYIEPAGDTPPAVLLRLSLSCGHTTRTITSHRVWRTWKLPSRRS